MLPTVLPGWVENKIFNLSNATLNPLLEVFIPKKVEVTGRLIEKLLPKHFQAVTARRFDIKVAQFALVCSISFISKVQFRFNHD
jgi:hypothetical protein